jgi:hypothetical protein
MTMMSDGGPQPGGDPQLVEPEPLVAPPPVPVAQAIPALPPLAPEANAAAAPGVAGLEPPIDTDAMAAALRASSGRDPLPPPAPATEAAPSPSSAAAAPHRSRAPGAAAARRTARKPARPRPTPDFSGLPPAMAQSLARLAGVPWPPQPNGAGPHDKRELVQENAGPAPDKDGDE